MRTFSVPSLAGRKAFLGGVSVFLVIAVFGFLTYEDIRSIDEIEIEIDGTHSSIEQSSAKIRRIPDLEREVVCLRENLREYVKILPDEDEVNDFVNKINKFADIAHVDVGKLDDVGAKRRKAQKSKDPFEKVEYKLQIKGNTENLLKFVNLFENHDRFVRVASFDLKSGKGTAGSFIDADIQLETFVYNPGGAAGAPVKIPDYEDKKLKHATEIVRSRGEIKIERYELAASAGRRDPFRDPRVAAGESGVAESVLTPEQQKQLFDALLAEVNEIESMIAAEAAPETGDDFIRKATLKKETDDRIINLGRRLAGVEKSRSIETANLKERYRSEVKAPVDGWMKSRNINSPTQIFSDETLAQFAKRMNGAFARADYDSVVKEYESASKGFAPVGASDRSKELMLEIVSLKERASANKEFAERNIVVNGVIYRPDGSVAVINGKVLSAGESLDGEIAVRAIEEDMVEFAYKQITIRKPVK
jgi:Tfp pilus assembly protein PilO